MPIPIFAEAIVRISEERMSAEQLADLLARGRGVVTLEDLPEQVQGKGSTTPAAGADSGGLGAAERGLVDLG
jgi:hypothetical protein